jgi:uncharacterized protein
MKPQKKLLENILVAVRMFVFIIKKKAQLIYKKPLPKIDGLRIEKDVKVKMRDGISLMANIYLPEKSGKYPVIMCMTPYGKDEQPEHYDIFKASGIDVGNIKTSDYAIFEGPDPAYWVKKGYVVIHANARGMWNSEGMAFVFDMQNGYDFYDLIEWAAEQQWSNGKIGLAGVSYLAWSQWMVASLNPPHLTAICPWEGFNDMYRELAYHGGIREIGLMRQLTKHRFNAHYNRKYGITEDLLISSGEHPFYDNYWKNKNPDLSKINVPALVCASWSDQGLHMRGSLIGYMSITSKYKWLYTHGRKKWETYYSNEALEMQTKFFDYFLKNIENDMLQQPIVRLEVRSSYYKARVRYADQWPIKNAEHRQLFLNASENSMTRSLSNNESFIRYSGFNKKELDRAVFTFKFEETTEITGGMRLKLWVSAESSTDFDLYVAIKKLDGEGNEVYFSGYNGNPFDMVAKGWLKVSHRDTNEALSTIEMPYHTHQSKAPLAENQIVPVEVEILPSSTLFEKGAILQLTIMGKEPIEYNTFKHELTMNKGFIRIYSGGNYDSFLLIPVVKINI